MSVRAVIGGDQAEREERKAKIKEMYLKCYTSEEIGEAVGLSKDQANEQVCRILEDFPKSVKVTFSEEDFAPPIYNVWTFAKKTNAIVAGNYSNKISLKPTSVR